MNKIEKELDSIDYSGFIEYLKAGNIQYSETECFDGDSVIVCPTSTTLKERGFSEDGGWQIL